MSRPFSFAGAVLELDFVPAIFAEEGFDYGCYGDEYVLKEVHFGLQDFPCCSNGVSDDSYVMDVVYFHYRDEASANGHEFCFDRYDIYGVDL